MSVTVFIIWVQVTDFHLVEVSHLQLDTVVHGVRRTCGAGVRKLQGVGNRDSTFVLSVETTMTSGQDVSESLDTLGLVKSYFFKFFGKKKLSHLVHKSHHIDNVIQQWLDNQIIDSGFQLSVWLEVIKRFDNQVQILYYNQYQKKKIDSQIHYRQ